MVDTRIWQKDRYRFEPIRPVLCSCGVIRYPDTPCWACRSK